jgi:hypothetical protein
LSVLSWPTSEVIGLIVSAEHQEQSDTLLSVLQADTLTLPHSTTAVFGEAGKRLLEGGVASKRQDSEKQQLRRGLWPNVRRAVISSYLVSHSKNFLGFAHDSSVFLSKFTFLALCIHFAR